MSKKKSKKPKRSDVKYPALDPKYNPKIRALSADYDYIDKLSPKEKAWLNSFTEEYIHGNFEHKGKKVHKKKEMTSEEYQEIKRESWNRNNWRNNDILNIAIVTDRIDSVSDFTRILDKKVKSEVEDLLVKIIDEEDES